LLTDASGGVVQTFRSSDQSGRTGIDYGENWYAKIAKTLTEATDVVALLTPISIGRPWILFEAGFAVGRLDTKVFGIALGLPLSKAVLGPFAQFQNCEANEESLTAVVLKLIQRNPQAKPREQAVRRQVAAFLQDVEPLMKQRGSGQSESKEELDASAVTKMFEEVKLMYRDLSVRLPADPDGQRIKRRRLHPGMFEELLLAARDDRGLTSLPWFMAASYLRDEHPWLHELVLEFARTLDSTDRRRIMRARKNLSRAVQFMRNSAFGRVGADDEESFFLLRYLPEMLERFAHASSFIGQARAAEPSVPKSHHHQAGEQDLKPRGLDLSQAQMEPKATEPSAPDGRDGDE
jgi:hypothetical protein